MDVRYDLGCSSMSIPSPFNSASPAHLSGRVHGIDRDTCICKQITGGLQDRGHVRPKANDGTGDELEVVAVGDVLLVLATAELQHMEGGRDGRMVGAHSLSFIRGLSSSQVGGQ